MKVIRVVDDFQFPREATLALSSIRPLIPQVTPLPFGLDLFGIGAGWAQRPKRRGFVLHALRFVIARNLDSAVAALAEIRLVAVATALSFMP